VRLIYQRFSGVAVNKEQTHIKDISRLLTYRQFTKQEKIMEQLRIRGYQVHLTVSG